MFQLQLVPYLLSKTLFVWITSLLQCILLLNLIDMTLGLNLGGGSSMQLLLIMTLTGACSAQLGLFLSALSSTAEQSLSAVAVSGSSIGGAPLSGGWCRVIVPGALRGLADRFRVVVIEVPKLLRASRGTMCRETGRLRWSPAPFYRGSPTWHTTS